MANTNKRSKKQPKQPDQQPTTPAKQVELSEAELGQVGGGFGIACHPGAPTPNPIFKACPPS